jgi:hypothetical protein
MRLTTCPVLECAVRVTDETSNRTIERPVFAQTISKKLCFKNKIQILENYICSGNAHIGQVFLIIISFKIELYIIFK